MAHCRPLVIAIWRDYMVIIGVAAADRLKTQPPRNQSLLTSVQVLPFGVLDSHQRKWAYPWPSRSAF